MNFEWVKIYYAYLVVKSTKDAMRRWNAKNKGKFRGYNIAYNRRYYHLHRQTILDKQRLYSQKNRDQKRKTDKRYVALHLDQVRGYARKHYRLNRAKCLAATRAWGERHPEKRREYAKRYYSKPHIRCHLRVIKAMKSTFGRGRSFRKWQQLLGYSAHDLKRHLENLFTAGMSWGAFMRGEIHIDHIIPKASFRFTSEDDLEFKRCWALGNLQPLWAMDNIRKGAKLPHELFIRGAA